MHKYIILFFSVSLFLISCKGNKVPDGIIPKDRMVSLLTEVHIADGASYSIPPAPDSLYLKATGRYIFLFKKYQTDSVQFRKSVRYYANHSDEFLVMYDKVMQNLKEKADSLNKIIEKPTNAVPHK